MELRTTMDRWVFSFITGSFLSMTWQILPPPGLLLIIGFLACVVLRLSHGNVISGFMFGTLWVASVGHWTLSWQHPSSHISEIQQLTGEIVSIVEGNENVSFVVKVNRFDAEASQTGLLFRPKVRLTWREPGWRLKQGQLVKLTTRLKPSHGRANEGTFQYQQWLFSQNIIATGYVKTAGSELLDNNTSWRQGVYDGLRSFNLKYESWILALSLGERGRFSKDQWQLVQHTGIAHLLAISGLHLAAVAVVCMFSVRAFFSVFGWVYPFRQSINILSLTTIFTLLFCFLYSWLAGFAVPVLRAWLMLAIVSFIMVQRSKWRTTSLLMYCVCLFILLFPHSLFSASFWLSFGAVTCILFIVWRWSATHIGQAIHLRWTGVFRVQVILCLLMLPILGWQFNFVSVLSPLINLIAVPFVTFLVVPLCLAGTLFLIVGADALALFVFLMVDELLHLGLSLLSKAAQLPFQTYHFPYVPFHVWVGLMLFIILLLLPVPKKFKSLGGILFLPFATYQLPVGHPGWSIDVLDVGQGTSVLISKQGRGIMYDVGAAFEDGFNAAESVIIPVLKAKGIKQLDLVIISHYDNDHAGALPYLLSNFPVSEVISNIHGCNRRWRMHWQGITLESIWPINDVRDSQNHNSCVVTVTGAHHRVLLAGDIDKAAEYQLTELFGDSLKSDVLIAPHHGSNTSSSQTFVNMVNPKHVVFTVGFMNQWDFPRQNVVNRYFLAQARMHSTAESGQIRFEFGTGEYDDIDVIRYRADNYNYWYANY